MRLVFAGTPQAAVPSLEALLGSRHSVVAVITRPDAPAGRGLRLAASPVADRARQADLEVLQPERPSDPEFLARLGQIAPDCCPVTAYGALIPPLALRVPAHGWVNLHFSVLPAWRGAAPVQHAILHGDELLVATMDGIEAGDLEARPQPDDGISLAPKIGRDDARVRWSLPALAVDRLIRACTPAPGAWTTLAGARIKLGPISWPDREATGPGELRPGEVAVRGGQVLAGTGTTPVALGELQPEGKRRMAAGEWLRGIRSSQVVLA